MPFSRAVGRLEVVCGPMFSGKSEELIRRMRRAQIAQRKTQLFKHASDNRKTLEHVHSHSGDKLQAYATTSIHELEQFILPETEVIGIDEVQFYNPEIVLLIEQLITRGKRVIVAGLDLDFRGLPFGCMPILLALADDVQKLKAVCMRSGKDASFTQRIVAGKPARYTEPIVVIGAEECYEARSRECFEIDYKPLAEYLEKYFGS